ncbi:hypothetical protein GCM10009678_92210 [Actinomadura kijaniata]
MRAYRLLKAVGAPGRADLGDPVGHIGAGQPEHRRSDRVGHRGDDLATSGAGAGRGDPLKPGADHDLAVVIGLAVPSIQVTMSRWPSRGRSLAVSRSARGAG